MTTHGREPLNAFCIDVEEWFHVCGVNTPYSDPKTWNSAPAHVEADTEILMRLLDEAGVRGTFLTLGWIAERYPNMIRRLADAGHEIGSHGYWHRLVYELQPDEYERDLAESLEILRDLSGQPVNTFRAPSFSIKKQAFWAYPIMRRHGVDVDVSIVPAARDDGGVSGFPRHPLLIRTDEGDIRCLPVSVMNIGGKAVQFSGGGYLRLFPLGLIKAGFRQNHRLGLPGMSYIHPREVNPDQPRLPLPRLKSFKYYINLKSTEEKLRRLLKTFQFTTVAEVVACVRDWPMYELDDGEIREAGKEVAAATSS